MYKLEEINLNEYDRLLNSDKVFSNVTFTQMPEYTKARKAMQNKTKLIKITCSITNKTIAILSVFYTKQYKIFFKANILYGPIFFDNMDAINQVQFWNLIKEYLLKDFLTIELYIIPYIINFEQNEKEKIENDNQKFEKSILDAGFIKYNQQFYDNPSVQMKTFYTKKIENLEYNQILNSISSLRKRNIKSLNKNEGIKIKKISINEIDIFVDLLNKTYDKHSSNLGINKNFIYNIIKFFGDKAYLLGTEVNIPIIIKKYENDLKNIKGDDENTKNRITKIKSYIDKYKEIQNQINTDTYYSDISLFIVTQNQTIYFLNGSYNNLTFENTLAHDYMFKIATENKSKIYNFFGIHKFDNPNDEGYGVYKYKTTYKGEITDLMGSYYAPSKTSELIKSIMNIIKK